MKPKFTKKQKAALKKRIEETATPWHNKPKNIQDYLGFIYYVHRKSDGKFYWGQKKYWKSTSKPPTAFKKRQLKESNWRNYKSSSFDLQVDVDTLGVDAFDWIIHSNYKDKWSMTYNELMAQLNSKVLEKETNSYNKYVGCRLNKRK